MTGVLVALTSLVLSLALVEAGLWLFHPLPDPYLEQKRLLAGMAEKTAYVPRAMRPNLDQRYVSEPGLPGMHGRPTRFTTNAYGYRGGTLAMPKPAGELRVFVVGGSTTECIFLDDGESLTAVLERRLRAGQPGARVYGAGRSGDKSWDHVAMVAHRVVHLQPDVVVVFAGINDLAAGIAGRDYLLREGDEGTGSPGRRVLRLASTELQLGRVAYWAFGPRSMPRDGVKMSGYRGAVAHLRSLPPTDRPPPADPAAYERNLLTLAGLARAHGFRLVLMTQGTTWNSRDPREAPWHWMLGEKERYGEELMDAAMERYNDAMRRVGAAQGIPVFDLARTLPKSMDFYYDDVHFNPRGADTTATLLARFIDASGGASDSVPDRQ